MRATGVRAYIVVWLSFLRGSTAFVPAVKAAAQRWVRGPAAATAAELRELLVQSVLSGASADVARCDELIRDLASARVPFRGKLLGTSASTADIWRAVYSSGKTPRWERNAKLLGGVFNNRAGQAYDTTTQRVVNYGEVLGSACYFTAEGSFSAVDGSRRCPKDFDVAIERGGFVLLGSPFISDAISGPGYLRVLYLDDDLRVFESPTDSPDRWEEAGLRVVQVRERNFA